MVEVQLAQPDSAVADLVFGLAPLLPKEVTVLPGQSPVVTSDRLEEFRCSGKTAPAILDRKSVV